MMRWVVSAAMLGTLVPVPAAGAAQLTSDRACYLPRTAIAATVSGATPGAELSLGGPGTSQVTGRADAAGTFSASLTAPGAAAVGARGTAPRPLTLTASDRGTGESTTLTVRVVARAFATDQQRTSAGGRRTWRFSGFLRPDAPVYGHFRFGGRTYANYRFGTPSGPCGLLTARAPGFPVRRPRVGTWTIQVDQNPRYRSDEPDAVRASTRIFRAAR